LKRFGSQSDEDLSRSYEEGNSSSSSGQYLAPGSLQGGNNTISDGGEQLP